MGRKIKIDIERKPGVYKITNKINNKIYIGSSRNLYVRKYEHWGKLKSNKHHNIHLQRAVNKYGIDNFKFEVIEYVDDRNDIIEKEQYWINKLKPYDNDIGYNILATAFSQIGAKRTQEQRKNIQKSQKSYPVLQFSPDGVLIKEWYSAKEVSRELNISENAVRKRCSEGGDVFLDSLWMFKEYKVDSGIRDKKEKGKYVGNKKIIIQYSKDGELIKEWRSIREASNKLNINDGNISKCCKLKKKSAGGFIWKYKNLQGD